MTSVRNDSADGLVSGYAIERIDGPHGRTSLVAWWAGRRSAYSAWGMTRSGDGCVGFFRIGGPAGKDYPYWYQSELPVLAAMVATFQREHEAAVVAAKTRVLTDDEAREEWKVAPANCGTHLTPLEARAFLDNAAFRVKDVPAFYRPDGSVFMPAWQHLEVLHDGVWKRLCRTDLKDDVATYRHTTANFSRDVEIEKYKHTALHGYGARVNDRRFAVIDCWSDG